MLASEIADVLDKLASVADDDATMERMTAACIRSLLAVCESARVFQLKLADVHDDPRYKSIFAQANLHGQLYQGPFYHDEWHALIAALASARKDGWLP